MNFKKWFSQQYVYHESSDISPQRFRDADISDIVDFVEELLYKKNSIDITEKVAGQHISIFIKDNNAYTSTKDAILQNKEPKDARYSGYGAELTSGIIKVLKEESLPDQTWRFEIIHPRHNHDYIKYKNPDTIYVEYTGKLNEDVANKIRKYISVKLLTKNDIKIDLAENEKFKEFKKEWEQYYKEKLLSLDQNQKGYYYNNIVSEIKDKVGDLLEDAMVSTIDKKSPVEGVVVGTKYPIKIQTNTFLKVQRVQMPMYSIFKISRHEIPIVLQNPTMPFEEIQTKFNLKLNSIYTNKLKQSLYTTVKYYLSENSNLKDIDLDKYRRWLTPEESQEYLKKLTPENTSQIYMEIYKKAN